jgi:hypothetical protein
LYGSTGILLLLEKLPRARLTPLPLIGLPTPRMRLAVAGSLAVPSMMPPFRLGE